MNARPLTVLAPLLLALASCRAPVSPPAGWIELSVPAFPYEYQYVSADDSRLGYRVVPNDGEGDLGFWCRSIQNQLTLNRGYELVSMSDVETEGGMAGKELLFRTSAKGVDYVYLVAFFPFTPFLGSPKLALLEAGGERSILEPELDAVRAAIRSLR
ncbi:MAG: hypothetical protein R3F30_14240 [Planctomycetota bacterium]